VDKATLIAILAMIFASAGFWNFLMRFLDKKSAKTRLLMGLGFQDITDTGMKFIDRGYITQEEFHDLYHYLYEPYRDMGGDGTAERVMEQVKKLPFKEG